MNSTRSRQKRYWIGALIGVAAVLLAACAGEEATVTPTTAPPTPTPVVTGATPTPVPATATPTTVVGEQPKYGGVLNLWARREAANNDVGAYGGIDFLPRYGPVIEGIIIWDQETNSKILPSLAESWEVSEDGKTYTFHLRKGVKWHDGVPFTAEDVRWYYNRCFNPPAHTLCPRRLGLASFEEVRAIDDYTVVFEFGAVEVEVLPWLAYPRNRFLSKHQVEPLDKEEKPVPPEIVGTGAFKLKTYRPESITELERNPDYWAEGLPYLDGIRVATGRDRATMLAAFRTGRIDITARGTGMYIESPEMIDILKAARPDITVWMKMGTSNTFWPNNQKEPWTDPRVRRAVSLGVDRQFICQAAFGGLCQMAIGVPPGAFGALPQDELLAMPGYRQPKDQDLAEAKRLLAEAGFPDGFETEIAVRSPSRSGAEPLAFELEKIGIRATLRIFDTTTFEELRYTGDYHSNLQTGGYYGQPGMVTAKLAADTGCKSGSNYGQVCDAKLDEMVARQSSMVDVAEREEMVREIWRYILDQAFFSLLSSPKAPLLVSGEVKNFFGPVDTMPNNEHTETWLERK